jgi:phasin family protein
MAISGDKISSMQQEQFNATMRLANVAMSNAQKMISMQAAAAKAMFEDSMSQAQLMTQAGSDPQAQLKARTTAMQQSAQRLMDMSREMAETLAKMQTEFQQLFSEHLQTSSSRMMESLQAIFSNMPSMPADATRMFEQATATMRGAFEQMTSAAQTGMGTMMKGMQSAGKAAEDATASAAKKKAKE